MAKIKSYSDLQQSKKLAEILPLESADMHYKVNRHNNESKIFMIPYSELGYYKDNDYQYSVCAWSLAALLEIIKKLVGYSLQSLDTHTVFMYCELGDRPYNIETENYDNPVDACVAMIERLHELNLL